VISMYQRTTAGDSRGLTDIMCSSLAGVAVALVVAVEAAEAAVLEWVANSFP